ncbi:hypothetical protein HDU96_006632 [Phlyctochytrium bullatum]|nr:hypothetical protein HDU96_006632 [Phlyctochytrium bullatum]
MATKTVLLILFDDFAVLDVFGPLQFLASVKHLYRIQTATSNGRSAVADGGIRIEADLSFADVTRELDAGAKPFDVLFVPGGFGTRKLVNDSVTMEFLKWAGTAAGEVWSVCTGSALLAKAGLLDGVKATSNKAAWQWVTSQSSETEWLPVARYIHDGKFWTSSGVAAGMDMLYAILREEFARQGEASPEDAVRKIADRIEYEPHLDASWDPFAKVHGVV